MVRVNISDYNVPELISDLWLPLTEKQRERLAANFTLRMYKKNEVVHCEDEAPTHM